MNEIVAKAARKNESKWTGSKGGMESKRDNALLRHLRLKENERVAWQRGRRFGAEAHQGAEAHRIYWNQNDKFVD